MLTETTVREAAQALDQRKLSQARFYALRGELMFGPKPGIRTAIVADCPDAESIAAALNAVLAEVYTAKLAQAEASLAAVESTMKGA